MYLEFVEETTRCNIGDILNFDSIMEEVEMICENGAITKVTDKFKKLIKALAKKFKDAMSAIAKIFRDIRMKCQKRDINTNTTNKDDRESEEEFLANPIKITPQYILDPDEIYSIANTTMDIINDIADKYIDSAKSFSDYAKTNANFKLGNGKSSNVNKEVIRNEIIDKLSNRFPTLKGKSGISDIFDYNKEINTSIAQLDDYREKITKLCSTYDDMISKITDDYMDMIDDTSGYIKSIEKEKMNDETKDQLNGLRIMCAAMNVKSRLLLDLSAKIASVLRYAEKLTYDLRQTRYESGD